MSATDLKRFIKKDCESFLQIEMIIPLLNMSALFLIWLAEWQGDISVQLENMHTPLVNLFT